MKPRQVDLVLVVDASHNMRPCFDQLKANLQNLLLPLNQANFKVRIGLVAYAAAAGRRHPVYEHAFIGGSGPVMLAKLYSHRPDESAFFTENPAEIGRALGELSAQGNKNTRLALDVAADLPFAPAASTRRVITLFSDERIEDGVTGEEPVDKIPHVKGQPAALALRVVQMAALARTRPLQISTERRASRVRLRSRFESTKHAAVAAVDLARIPPRSPGPGRKAAPSPAPVANSRRNRTSAAHLSE